MISSENQSNSRLNARLAELIKTNLNAIKPDLDWNQIAFEEDSDGHIVRLRSANPTLDQWLRQAITITRPESTEPVVAYPNAFANRDL